MIRVAAVDHERVRRLLGGDDLAWLVERLRRRLLRGRPLVGKVIRHPATAAERAAVARLLGRPLRDGASVGVDLDDLAEVLARAGIAPDLRTAVEALVGPVTDEAAKRAAEQRAWRRVVDQARTWASTAGLDGWLDHVAGSGLLRRQAGGSVEEAAHLLNQVAAVVTALPAGGVPLPRLAAAALGDTKALDRDRPVAALAVGAAAVLGGVPPSADPQTITAWRREAWASVGVLVGALLAPVLTIGLPGDASTGTGRLLAVAAERGEPLHLSLRHLVGDPPRHALRGRRVWVCENPTVVAVAADALGTACPPLVCTEGQPSTAVATLLRQLVSAGATLGYHGDFDWPGLQMTHAALRRFDAVPWRMGTADYLVAVPRSRRPLAGNPVNAVWDDLLRTAMEDAGVAVEEELVIDELLADLAT